MKGTNPPARWNPTQQQLGKQTKEGLVPTTEKLEMAFREMLRLHYELQDSHADLKSKVEQNGKSASPQPTSTAAVTNMLGLPVFPSDTTQLADGTKLTYVAARRRFEFL
jgi:hypothetical protein